MSVELKKSIINGFFAIIAVFGTIFGYYFTEQSKIVQENYIRKEKRYTNLINSLRGFTVSGSDSLKRQEFISELNLCWLYCDDTVIKAGYEFLESVAVGSKIDEVSQKNLLAQFVLEIRKDMLSRKIITETQLDVSDFKHLEARK